MYKNIINKLKCPVCGTDMKLIEEVVTSNEIIEGTAECESKHHWLIREGVLDFNAVENEVGNQWSKMYEETDYETLDRQVMKGVPEIQKEGYKVTIHRLIEDIEESESSWVLDVATGRGMLLVELVKHFGERIQFVCVDLSFEVLKYNRLKCLAINPDAQINFISCDATNLPLKDNSLDLSVSFAGIANMEKYAMQGVNEAVRVAKKGLYNTTITIADDNPCIHS